MSGETKKPLLQLSKTEQGVHNFLCDEEFIFLVGMWALFRDQNVLFILWLHGLTHVRSDLRKAATKWYFEQQVID